VQLVKSKHFHIHASQLTLHYGCRLMVHVNVRGVSIYSKIEEFLEAMTWHSLNPRFFTR